MGVPLHLGRQPLGGLSLAGGVCLGWACLGFSSSGLPLRTDSSGRRRPPPAPSRQTSRVPRPAWLGVRSCALSRQSSLRIPQCRGLSRTTHYLAAQPPAGTVNGGIHYREAALEAVAKASHQYLTLVCQGHGETILHAHPTREADGVGRIAFCLISGGDIQTPNCSQRFTMTPPLWQALEVSHPGVSKSFLGHGKMGKMGRMEKSRG